MQYSKQKETVPEYCFYYKPNLWWAFFFYLLAKMLRL